MVLEEYFKALGSWVPSDPRTPLAEGAVVDGKYKIEKLKAEGGSCLVYDASYTDDIGATHKVVLKELYPHDRAEKIKREENGCLTGVNADFEEFKKACLALNDLENAPSDIANNAQTTIDNFKANGTCYNVMTLGATVYSEYEGDSKIRDILSTAKALTEVVGKIHDLKLLHMDIKPQNFAVEKVGSEKKITLFDVDSFAPLNEKEKLQSGAAILSSPGYWAPEVRDVNRLKICPASDLYSVGVVLLESILGRLPDEISALANWKFPEDVFKDGNEKALNPKVEKRVRLILSRLFRAEPTGRFQSAEALLEKLKETIELCTASYVRSNIGDVQQGFVGRKKELDAVRQEFENGKRIVALEGVGGIGKTQLAKKYWEESKNAYDVGVCLDFRNGVPSLDEKLKGIEIGNYDDKDEDKRLKTVKDLLNQNGVLIYVDNFDVPTEGDERDKYNEAWKSLQNDFPNAHVLITTRAHLSDLVGGEVVNGTEEIEVGAMEEDTAWEMFQKAAAEKCKGDDKAAFGELYKAVAGNTLALSILAKLYKRDVRYQGLEAVVAAFRGRLSGIRINFADRQATAEEALCSIYAMQGLDGEHKRALLYVYFFHRTRLDNEMLEKIFPNADAFDDILNLLNDLTDWGWVIAENTAENTAVWSLHPLVVRTIQRKENNPKEEEEGYFEDLERFRFWMYFRLDKLGRIVAYRESLLESNFLTKLVSCFEPGDRLDDGITVPEDCPNLNCTPVLSPFHVVLKAQRDGYLGTRLEVAEGNPYYQSRNNCIFGKGDDKRLYMMSIRNSAIPQDAGIEIITAEACAYNQNDKVVVPASVSVITYAAFLGAKIKRLHIAGDSTEIHEPELIQTGGNAFNRMDSDSTIVLDRLPKGSLNAFVDCPAKLEFTNADVVEDSDCLVDKNTGELIGFHYMTISREGTPKVKLRISPLVRRIGERYGFDRLRVVLPVGLEYIDPRSLRMVESISMDGEGEYYTVVDDCLVRKADGAVIYCPKNAPLPTAPCITKLEEHSNITIDTDGEYRIPDNIKRIEARAMAALRRCKTLILPAGLEFIGYDALRPWSRASVTSIRYEGTLEQWHKLMIASADVFLPQQTVECADGTYEGETEWKEIRRARKSKT